ncbi:hypothetical protein PGIGA_G00164110 [Pangasianodon gigas]|uniref:Uncharacterized protein n=1 Tax=Pangasianodon gigas TaxID=30993 RepID=A0ACC5XS22_PANGG|nr:hypothetical protein [Pangasianodon gigas]
MFIETVLLFLLVKNLVKVRSNQREVLSLKWLNMIGYLIPLVVVLMCALAIPPKKSINEKCWGTHDIDTIFDIPVLFIVAVSTTDFFTAKHINHETSYSVKQNNIVF